MNITRQIDKIEKKLGMIFNIYRDMKKNIAQIFILNAQGDITPDNARKIIDRYVCWELVNLQLRTEIKDMAQQAQDYLEQKVEKVNSNYAAKKYTKSAYDKVLIELTKLNKLFVKLDDLKNSANAYGAEIICLWTNAVKEVRLPYEGAILDSKDIQDFSLYFSESIENLYYKLFDKSEDGVVHLNSFEENIIERGLAVRSISSPTVLHENEIKALKKLAKKNGVECNLVKWTPENCIQIYFENDTPKTPFKEMDDEIILV